jgi:hypothetical protein
VENFKDPRTNQILLLLICDKRRLKFGTILGSYLYFNGGCRPSIWLIFSDDSLKIKVFDSCKVNKFISIYLLRKVVCLLDWDLSNHRPLLVHLVLSLESHE